MAKCVIVDCNREAIEGGSMCKECIEKTLREYREAEANRPKEDWEIRKGPGDSRFQ